MMRALPGTRSRYDPDPIGRLFAEPDTLAAPEWQERHRSKLLSPPKRLMLAVLEDAVHCLLKGDHDWHGQRTSRRAAELAWFEADDAHALFSFTNICAVLGFDASYIRGGVRRLADRQPEARPAPLPATRQRRTSDTVVAVRHRLQLTQTEFGLRVGNWEHGRFRVHPRFWPAPDGLATGVSM